MAGIGDKTPVSCLQEYLCSKELVPYYELILKGDGTHNPLFIYRVQAGNHQEEGSGRSKREAKHKAAEKLLQKLNIVQKTDEIVSNDSFKESAENYVGNLKELCFNQCYPQPKYYLEESAGPPHNRIFRMVCCVSQLTDYGTGSTKKQAKHQAAGKMLQRLKELKTKTDGDSILKPLRSDKVEVLTENDVIIEKYNSLKRNNICPAGKDPMVLYKDHHLAYVNLYKESPTLDKILKRINSFDITNSLSLINNIAKELDVTLKESIVPNPDVNNSVCIITMSVYPSIAGLGNTMPTAAFNLLNSLLFLCGY